MEYSHGVSRSQAYLLVTSVQSNLFESLGFHSGRCMMRLGYIPSTRLSASTFASCAAGIAAEKPPATPSQQSAAVCVEVAWFERSGLNWWPIMRVEHDKSVVASRAQLDEQNWTTVWMQVRAMSIEAAIDYAFEGSANK